MASSYSTDLKLELMVTGENSGTWGDKTNNNLDLIQQAIAGYESVTVNGTGNTALAMTDATLSNARNAVIELTGTITGNITVSIPDGIEKTYYIYNNTTGAFTVQFKTTSGTGPTFTATDKGYKIVYSDGTDVIEVPTTPADGSITSAKLATDAVITAKISAAQVTNAKLANKSITLNGVTATLGSSVTIATGTDWQSAIKTTTFTAAVGEGYWVNTTAGAFTVTLPGSASVGDTIELVDYARTWGTNGLTLNTNGLNFQNNSGLSPVYNTEGQALRLVYSGATGGWIPTDDDSVTNKDVVSAEYLVVAGGASGSNGQHAGGGAGGLLTNYGSSTIGLIPGETYTATVGGGGAGLGGAPQTRGNSGNDSSLIGPGVSLTAFGGGAGGSNPGIEDGLSGGSGGGAGQGGVAGSGTVGQGNDGGPYIAPQRGGGGGAGEAGGTDGTGFGGDGLSVSITGSATFYAGGGGGGAAGPGSGGDGGGTDGVSNPASSANSPANTGGGTGGANDAGTGNGGSGVVIIRVPTADYPGTTTGSPTVTTDGTDTVIKFTSTGSYTA